MFRLYAQYDVVAVRTARRYKQFQKAIEVAKTIKARFVEVRLLTPKGTERLTAIIKDGNVLAT